MPQSQLSLVQKTLSHQKKFGNEKNQFLMKFFIEALKATNLMFLCRLVVPEG